MIKSFKITNHLGNSLYLDIRKPEDTGFLVTSVSGLTPPKAEVSESEFSTADGIDISGVRVGSRSITFTLIFYQDNNEKLTVEELRHICYEYFPVKKEIQIEITNDSGIYRTSGTIETNEITIFTIMEGAQINVICPDPYFWSKDSSTLNMWDVKPAFEFPVIFEDTVEFSTIDTSHQFDLYYNGAGDCGVTLKIYSIGSVGDIYIYDQLTNGYMKIISSRVAQKTGHPVMKGDYITINTRRGKKSASLLRNGITHNILHAISTDSEWTMLHQGLNRFAYVATSGVSNLKISIDYEVNCLGV